MARNPSRRRRRRRNSATMVNPRRRRSLRRVRRRRNPGGIGQIIRDTIKVAIPALGAGFGIGYLDSKVLGDKSTLVRVGGKIGLAAAIGVLLRRRPDLARAAMATVIGTLGYEQGLTIAGGTVAVSKPAAAKQLAALVFQDQQAMGYLAENLQGMGLSLGPMSGTTPIGDGAQMLDVNLG
jgi:hypothetical protein